MGNFAGTAPESIADRYKGGIKIYLESEEDVAIIGSKWFFAMKDRYSFESADDGDNAESGGCRMVIKRVEQARSEGLEAFGIVDRDILLNCDGTTDQLWWETDDSALNVNKPFGDHIHVLRRWEIENYLLHPEALAHLIANKKLVAEAKPQADIAQALIEHEEDMITVTLLTTLTVSKGLAKPNDGFGKHEQGEQLLKSVMGHLRCDEKEFREHHEKVLQFTDNKEEQIERWHKLSRMLDGKRIFHRLSKSLPELNRVDMSAERGTLADIIKNNGLIDNEFDDFLKSIH